MRYIKYILVVFLLLFLIKISMKDTVKNVPVETIAEKINPMGDIKDKDMVKGNQNSLRKYYGIDPESVKEFSIYIPNGVMAVNEMLLIKVKDTGDISEIKNSMNKRLAAQKKNFDGYGTTQLGILKQAVLEVRGDYVFFAISTSAGKWQQTFEKTIE